MLEKQTTTKEFYDILDLNLMSYYYRGSLTQSITDGILALTETNLTKAQETVKVKKRIYAILIEGLQNITRHQDISKDQNSFFGIKQTNDFYFITMANIIESKKVNTLCEKLNKINSLEKEELKQFYKKALNENDFSEKGGAGLGLIEMARKSGSKLLYSFRKIDEKTNYFYLKTYIKQDTKEIDNYQIPLNFDNIYKLHDQLNNENALIIFNGMFNQESLINHLSIIESQMEGQQILKKKIFNIMVELLQNIVKHGIAPFNINGNPGMFYISNSKDGYTLHTGNYIKNEKIESLKQKINNINQFSNEELNDFYDKRLFNFQIDNIKESGLGLIELRLKSNNILKYSFKEINQIHSFFTLEVTIKN